MRRPLAVLGLCAIAWATPAGAADAPAPAAEPSPAAQGGVSATLPGVDQLQFAAREHDLGYRAYVDKRYDEAASHFETAFFAAPNPAELRSAIRARRDAGQMARAATLAAVGQRRFPNDPATAKVAAEVIGQAQPHVFEVNLTSSADYVLALDQKVLTVERARDVRFFLDPGAHELIVSWADDRNTRVPIDATEGGTKSLELEPPPAPVSAPPTPPPAVPAAPPATAVQPSPNDAPPPGRHARPLPPAVFLAGAALTLVAGGITTWSGIQTLNSPGQAAVRQNCAGKSLSQCPDLQTGLDEQRRTNILFGVTGGLAVATAVVGLFFTQWGSSEPAPVHAGVTPVVGIGSAGIEGTF